MLSAKVSTKNQISLPSEARRALGIEPGDRLDVRVRDQELVLTRRPARASERLRGIAKGMYGPNPVAFVRQLRDELEEDLREREAVVAREPRRSSPQGRARRQRPDLPAR